MTALTIERRHASRTAAFGALLASTRSAGLYRDIDRWLPVALGGGLRLVKAVVAHKAHVYRRAIDPDFVVLYSSAGQDKNPRNVARPSSQSKGRS